MLSNHFLSAQLALFLKMDEQGYLCADVPDAHGGPGAPMQSSFAVVEVLSCRGYAGCLAAP